MWITQLTISLVGDSARPIEKDDEPAQPRKIVEVPSPYAHLGRPPSLAYEREAKED